MKPSLVIQILAGTDSWRLAEPVCASFQIFTKLGDVATAKRYVLSVVDPHEGAASVLYHALQKLRLKT